MPFFHFKLVDSRIVSDHGVHDVPDDAPPLWRSLVLPRLDRIDVPLFDLRRASFGAGKSAVS